MDGYFSSEGWSFFAMQTNFKNGLCKFLCHVLTTARHYNSHMISPISAVTKPDKIPRSTLVVIFTPKLEVLLIERADRPGYWQSVTGSQNEGETPAQTAVRELYEETGLVADQHQLTDWKQQNQYEIYAIWAHRYAPNVTHNTEHVFSLRVSARVPIKLTPREHLQYVWLPYKQAAEKCFSATNREAILALPKRLME